MDPGFWHRRWQEGRIGFHHPQVLPLLAEHWDAAAVAGGGRVFVPLCGKSLDMPWLVQRGHRVLGVELSPLAVEAFFEERAMVPEVHASASGLHYVAGPYELIVGDAFALDAATLADCVGIYDRAALIALPPSLRARYLGALYGRLPMGCRGLLVTLEYPQVQKAGPPFSVDTADVVASIAPGWRVDVLERRDILAHEPGFVAEGVTALSTVAYRLHRSAGATP